MAVWRTARHVVKPLLTVLVWVITTADALSTAAKLNTALAATTATTWVTKSATTEAGLATPA